jgi:hypothetical protein
MYMMYMMIRKQLYLEARQDRALKRRAKQLGVSEADVVRAALDAALREPGATAPALLPIRDRALKSLLDGAREIAATHRTKGSRYVRDELYEERESRWTGRK